MTIQIQDDEACQWIVIDHQNGHIDHISLPPIDIADLRDACEECLERESQEEMGGTSNVVDEPKGER